MTAHSPQPTAHSPQPTALEQAPMLELEQLFKEKKWQNCIDLAEKLKNSLSSLDDAQVMNFYWWIGHAYKELKRYSEAEEQFNLLTATLPNLHQGIQGLVESANHEQNWEKAIKYSLQLQEKKPDMWQGYWWAGHAYKNLKQYEQAEEQFNLLTATLPNLHQGIQGLVESANHEQNWEKAIKYSLQLQEKKPNMWHSYWWIGHAYKELYEYDKAEATFKQLIEILPNDQRGYEGLVNVAQHQQDKEKVIERATIFQEKFPNMWHSYWWIGHAYKELCEYEKAQQQFEVLKEKFPNDHFYYQGMIDIANHQNNWQDLFTFSESYIQNLPNRIDGHYHQGMALKNLKKFDEAEQFFIELAEQFPHYAHPYVGLANVYYTLRKWDKGIQVLEKILVELPNDSWIVNSLINHYLIYNEPEKAMQIFEQYFSKSANIHHQLLLARIYQIQHGNRYYLDMLETLYEKYPDDVSVAMDYANALINFTLDEV